MHAPATDAHFSPTMMTMQSAGHCCVPLTTTYCPLSSTTAATAAGSVSHAAAERPASVAPVVAASSTVGVQSVKVPAAVSHGGPRVSAASPPPPSTDVSRPPPPPCCSPAPALSHATPALSDRHPPTDSTVPPTPDDSGAVCVCQMKTEVI